MRRSGRDAQFVIFLALRVEQKHTHAHTPTMLCSSFACPIETRNADTLFMKDIAAEGQNLQPCLFLLCLSLCITCTMYCQTFFSTFVLSILHLTHSFREAALRYLTESLLLSKTKSGALMEL